MPTPQGDLGVSWKRTGGKIALAVKAPKGMRTEIAFAGQRKLLASGGTAKLNG